MKNTRQTIGDHLGELRKRLALSVIAIVVCTSVSFIFHGRILDFLMQPALGFAQIPNQAPIYTEMTELIGTVMKVSLLFGFILAFPFVLLQCVMFVAPGLNKSERRYLYSLVPFTLMAFIVGAAFGYRVLFPPAVNFLLTFGDNLATPFIRIGNYTNLMLTLLFWMGIVFETPIIAFFLSKIGVVTPDFLARNRKYAVVASFILGAIITPTFDPINQTLVALPIIVMYEFGIWLAKLGNRGKNSLHKSTGNTNDD